MSLLNQKKIKIITNIIAPYRTPIFESLSKIYNLQLIYLQKKDKKRMWKQDFNSLNFDFILLNTIELKFFYGRKFFLPRIISLYKIIIDSDIIIGTDNPPNILSLLYIFLISKMHGKKFIFWVSIWDKYYFRSPKHLFTHIIKYYVVKISKYSDSIICYGQEARDFLEKKGIDNKKMFFGTQVHPQSYKKSYNHLYTTNQNKIRILSLCYLQKRKGVADIINVIKLIDVKNIKLDILGDGPELNTLKELAGASERIVFHGHKDGQEKYNLLKNSDIMVCTTYMDPWSLNVNEALAFKLPVIVSTNAGCAMELVKDNGVTYKAGDIKNLKRKLEYFIGSKKVRNNFSKRSTALRHKLHLNYAKSTFDRAINFVIMH